MEGPNNAGLAALRQYTRPRAPEESCDLCGVALGGDHQHLAEPSTRRLLCACDACSILFGGPGETRYRRVPRRVESFPEFQMTDGQWDSLMIPISLAFFYRSTPAGRVVALYPSPAGATESLLPLDAWATLAEQNPPLRELEPDVEALLAYRVGPLRAYYRVPIDECFKLVGLIRVHWRGLSGVTEVWREIRAFFDRLDERASPIGGGARA